jgi:hypothetical protein
MALLVSVGCAARLPTVAITDLSAVAGTWEGNLNTPSGRVPATVTIDSGGTYQTTVNGRLFPGVLTLDNGLLRTRSAVSGRTGTWTLRQSADQRVLVFQSDDSSVYGEARPAR